MKTMTRSWFLVVLLGLLPASARAAPSASADHHGIVVRAGGDLRVGSDELASAAIVLGGNAEIRGHVGTLLVVGGDAVLDGARADDVTVVGGRALLHDGTQITGDLRLIDSALERDPLVEVGGRVVHETGPRWQLSSLFGVLLALGVAAALVLAGVLAVAVAPQGMARSATMLLERPARAFVWAAAAYLLVPLVAFLCMRTILGIPVAVGALFFVLPSLAFLGFLVGGYALGRQLVALGGARDSGDDHPLLAAALGLATLMLFCAVPIAGPLVAVLAMFVGSGALVAVGARTLSSWRRRAADPTLPLAHATHR